VKANAADLFSGVLPFVTAAEAKSFRVAARKLGLTPSAVSKAVTRLEARLGLRLLNRSSRSVSLTEDGDAFLRGCQQAVASMRSAEEQVLSAQRAPRGRLTVSLPLMLGRTVVLPALKDFCERYPALSVHATLTDRMVNLADENVDASVRVGLIADSRLLVRKLRDIRWVTVAAPAYLARRGLPRTPAELAAHNCLKFVLPNGTVREWEFAPAAGVGSVSPPHGSLLCDNGDGLIAAAESGLGIFQAHDYSVSDALAAGRLVEILEDFEAPGPPVALVLPPGKRTSPKIRAFVEFMLEVLAGTRGRSLR
jgi:LysR family transcriptional regulator, regulator for bpeEF and oprC